jgi:hypothetical protein
MYLPLLFRLFIFRLQIVESSYGVYVQKLLIYGLKEIRYMYYGCVDCGFVFGLTYVIARVLVLVVNDNVLAWLRESENGMAMDGGITSAVACTIKNLWSSIDNYHK